MTSVDSSVVRIPAFQAGGPGSIPGRRTTFCAISLVAMIPRCQRGGPGSIPGWRTFFFSTQYQNHLLKKDSIYLPRLTVAQLVERGTVNVFSGNP